jgi:heme/copper-type cytochrome/quinol oxidase subunit 2
MRTKVIFSRRQPLDFVDNVLVIPENRPVRFLVTSPDGVIYRWGLPDLGIDCLASPVCPDGEFITIGRRGLFSWVPYSQPGYPHPNDRSFPMPVVMHVVSEPVFNDWFWSNKGEEGNPD